MNAYISNLSELLILVEYRKWSSKVIIVSGPDPGDIFFSGPGPGPSPGTT